MADPVEADPVVADGTGRLAVRYFAGARAAAGTREETVAADPGAPLAEVLDRLAATRPALARVLPACSFLLDGTAARREDQVGAATGLDVLPPFSGG
ncbi:MoaD/ThiS family protein [Aquipuribacter nitratireducens]|uniref:Molybdopterin synthase sulfur carrier subunit n=1 Tax=Aquipuribacter nitratireducens TaxID=650104 RepID=A0ABW0GLZ4_9MICO